MRCSPNAPAGAGIAGRPRMTAPDGARNALTPTLTLQSPGSPARRNARSSARSRASAAARSGGRPAGGGAASRAAAAASGRNSVGGLATSGLCTTNSAGTRARASSPRIWPGHSSYIAYRWGGPGCFTQQVTQPRDAGLACACSRSPGSGRQHTGVRTPLVGQRRRDWQGHTRRQQLRAWQP